MEQLKISEVAAAISARYQGPGGEISHVSTDSRDLPPHSLFVALKGERVDGHDYIEKILSETDAFVVAHRPVENDGGRVLYVTDTFPVLMDLARFYRSHYHPKVVGVTGSVGKTTTKEFVAAVLESRYKTLKSQGNHNNEIGLPKTVFRLDGSHEAAVLEMGMSALGDIRLLTSIAQPAVGIITNIGVSHLEHLGSRENILRAKLEITEGMKDGAPLLLNGDNDLLSTVKDDRLGLIFYSIHRTDCPLRADGIQTVGESTRFTLYWAGETHPVTIPTIGEHNVYNALAAFGAGVLLGIPPKEAVAALGRYAPAGMRQKVVEHGGFTVVEDCYNASPDSMEAALTTLAQYPAKGRRVAVLADMLELGPISHEAHTHVGERAAALHIHRLLAYGEEARQYVAGAKAAGLLDAHHYESREALAAALITETLPGDVLWLKGSRGMELEALLPSLYGR